MVGGIDGWEMRLPLQIGRSMLIEVAVTGALSMPMVVGGALMALESGWPGAAGWVILELLGIALCLYSLPGMLRSRPSDVVISSTGCRIEGGPQHGFTAAWTELDATRCRVENDETNKDPPKHKLRGVQLIVGLFGKGDQLLAEVYQADDLPPLYVLRDLILAVRGHLAESEMSAPPPPRIEGIPGAARLMRRFSRQRSYRSATRIVAMLAVPMLLAAPLAGIVLWLLSSSGSSGSDSYVSLLLAVVAANFLGTALGLFSQADRQALRQGVITLLKPALGGGGPFREGVIQELYIAPEGGDQALAQALAERRTVRLDALKLALGSAIFLLIGSWPLGMLLIK